MAKKLVGGQEATQKKSANKKTKGNFKPSVREFYRDDKAVMGNDYPCTLIKEIFSAKNNCYYVILECDEFSMCIHRASSLAENLMEKILPNLNEKEANRIILTPNSSNKNGADVSIDDSVKGWYYYGMAEDDLAYCHIKDEEGNVIEKKDQLFTLEDFGLTDTK